MDGKKAWRRSRSTPCDHSAVVFYCWQGGKTKTHRKIGAVVQGTPGDNQYTAVRVTVWCGHIRFRPGLPFNPFFGLQQSPHTTWSYPWRVICIVLPLVDGWRRVVVGHPSPIYICRGYHVPAIRHSSSSPKLRPQHVSAETQNTCLYLHTISRILLIINMSRFTVFTLLLIFLQKSEVLCCYHW